MNTLINITKKIKRKIIEIINDIFVFIFSHMKMKDRAFFYTIRSDGKLLENISYVYDATKCEKVVFAKMLPHSYPDTLKAKYYMLTSKVIVIDDYLKYFRQVKLRPNQKVVQLWHASGAFKHFGLDAPSKLTRDEELRTHSQYTDVCVSSDYVRQFYARAFGIDISVVKALGSPRTDTLVKGDKCKNDRIQLENTYPEIKNKKIYLYLPTFREVDGTKIDFDPKLDWEKLNCSLNDDELFIVSRHPVMKKPFFNDNEYSKIKDYTKESTIALLSIASVVVTDYSSVIFDASLLNIPLTFYCPDYDSYERDFYLDFEKDLPGQIVKDGNMLLDTIRLSMSDDSIKDKFLSFKEKEMGTCDGNSTSRIAKLIDGYIG